MTSPLRNAVLAAFRVSTRLAVAAGGAALAEPIVEGLPDLLAEAVVAFRSEQAGSLGDVLLRRTRLGLLAAREACRPSVLERLADVVEARVLTIQDLGSLGDEPFDGVISAFASFLISALGTPETRWKETIIVGICLTIGCSLLFPYALGLPLQLFPRFLVQ